MVPYTIAMVHYKGKGYVYAHFLFVRTLPIDLGGERGNGIIFSPGKWQKKKEDSSPQSETIT
jgi:hypothetical protein